MGTKIAVIGAGCAGLCAAWELMKIGLHPVVYESDKTPDGRPRIGGRAYTFRFPGDPKAFAELGAMRIPPVHKTITFYMDLFNIDYSKPFPDPLLVPTTLYFNGQKSYIPLGGLLPGPVQKANEAWQKFIDPLVKKMVRVWNDPELRNQQWQKFIDRFKNRSFYQVLWEQDLTRQEISLFGSMGLGTGGFNSMFPVSFLEILRLSVCKWEVDQRIVKGGVDQLPKSFWSNRFSCPHWGDMSVKYLNNGEPLGRVKKIHTPDNPDEKIEITDNSGTIRAYDALIITCSHRALEIGIKVNRNTFSDKVWSAIHNIHMTRSGKVFIRTHQAFWKNHPPASTLNCTITDEAIRGTYLFDFEDTDSGVICLSYTWEDSATKLHALNEQEQVNIGLEILNTIYGRDLISDQIAETKTFFWEHAKGYNGAFKLNYPGQYEDQKALFEQTRPQSMNFHNGVFLSGESTSWAGGWIEGALHSGLDAALAVVKKLKGELHCV
ncbi:MAG: FAD-dependent oxidoreductase [Desulfobacula sp.]|nr:FAD-dependent oxidoreductase [Desulfobacula sp.]